MVTHVRCGSFFSGRKAPAQNDCTIAYGDNGIVIYAGSTAEAPPVAVHDTVLNYGNLFVMPGLVDIHTHLAYGNAKTEEDIDLYQPMEFRSLRGLFFAQKVVAAGYTSICAPGDAGQISLSVRDAINAGLFEGPRVTAAGAEVGEQIGRDGRGPVVLGARERLVVAVRGVGAEREAALLRDRIGIVRGALRGGEGRRVAVGQPQPRAA